jgi:hypothetical protein
MNMVAKLHKKFHFVTFLYKKVLNYICFEQKESLSLETMSKIEDCLHVSILQEEQEMA